MAAYPAHPQLIGSTEEWVDDITLDRAVGGGVKSRSFYGTKKRRFVLRHLLNVTDRGTFQTFYNNNRTAAVTLTWDGDGQAYTCLFESVKPTPVDARLTAFEVHLVEQ